MTSEALSQALKSHGINLQPSTVRRWCARGAPKASVDEFLDFYRDNRESNKPIPEGKPTDPLLALEATFAGVANFRITEDLDRDGLALLDEVERASKLAGKKSVEGEHLEQMLFAAGCRRISVLLQYTAALAGLIKYRRDPNSVPPETAEQLAEGLDGMFDLPVLLKELNVPLP
jgi:hypothetical protein